MDLCLQRNLFSFCGHYFRNNDRDSTTVEDVDGNEVVYRIPQSQTDDKSKVILRNQSRRRCLMQLRYIRSVVIMSRITLIRDRSMRVLLDEAITRRSLVMSEAKSESETEQLDRETLLQAISEREHLELLVDGDTSMSLIAEKLLEIDEEREEAE